MSIEKELTSKVIQIKELKQQLEILEKHVHTS